MSALRNAAERLRRASPPAILSMERLFATERAAAALAGRRLDAGARTAAARALRRRLALIVRETPAGFAAKLAEALAEERRSVDRAIIHAYLAALPSDRPDFALLAQAAETAANRHDWRWREAGEQLRLWSPERDAAGMWRLPQSLGTAEAASG